MINHFFKLFFVFYFSIFSIEAFAGKKDRLPAQDHPQTTGTYKASKDPLPLYPDLPGSSSPSSGKPSTSPYPDLSGKPPTTVPLLNPVTTAADVEAGKKTNCATKFGPKQYLGAALLLTTLVGGAGTAAYFLTRPEGGETPTTSVSPSLTSHTPALEIFPTHTLLVEKAGGFPYNPKPPSTTFFPETQPPFQATILAIPGIPTAISDHFHSAILQVQDIIKDCRWRQGNVCELSVTLFYNPYEKILGFYGQDGTEYGVLVNDLKDGEEISTACFILLLKSLILQAIEEPSVRGLYNEETGLFLGPISTFFNGGRPVYLKDGFLAFTPEFSKDESDHGKLVGAFFADLGLETKNYSSLLKDFEAGASPELKARRQEQDNLYPTGILKEK